MLGRARKRPRAHGQKLGRAMGTGHGHIALDGAARTRDGTDEIPTSTKANDFSSEGWLHAPSRSYADRATPIGVVSGAKAVAGLAV